MQKLLIILFLLSAHLIEAQSWEKNYLDKPGSPHYNTTYDYNYLNGGFVLRYFPNTLSNCLTRINVMGDTIWRKNISLTAFGPYSWSPEKVTRVNNNIFLGGYGDSVSIVYKFYFLAILDTNGNPISIRKYKIFVPQAADSYIGRSKNNSIFTLRSADPTNGSSTKIISKYDSNGALLWSQIFSTFGSWFGILKPEHTLDDGLIYTVYYQSGVSELKKMDSNGNVVWTINAQNVIPNVLGAGYVLNTIIPTRDSNFVVFGQRSLQSPIPPYGPENKSYLLKFNANGILIDSTSFPLNIGFSEGTQLSNSKLLISYGYFGNPTTSGFIKCDSNFLNLSYNTNVLNINAYYNFKLISNNLGGASFAFGNGPPGYFAANFDSLFNTYPYKVHSKIVLDNNQNCNLEITDKKISSGVIQITNPGNNSFYAFSDSSGLYKANIPNGTYTISHSSPGYKQYECPGTGQLQFTTAGTPSYNCTFYDTLIPNVKDFNLMLGNNWFASNDTTWFYAFCVNEGTSISNGTVTIQTDSCMQFISSIPPPLSVNGNTIVFSVSNIQPDSASTIQMFFNTAPFQPIGSTVNMYGSINCLNDVNLANNNDTLSGQVWPGFNKSASQNEQLRNNMFVTQPLYINDNKELVYKIQFQNLNDETVRNLVIVDTLSSNFDMRSFRILHSKYPNLKTEWHPNNKVIFRYNNLNIVSSGVNEYGSKGDIVFAIKLKPNIAPGTEIKNRAHLFFDYHGSISTQQTKNIIRANVLGVNNPIQENVRRINIYPNPANDFVYVQSKNAVISIEVFDTQGKITAIGKGSYLNTASISNGVYLLKIKTEGEAETAKLIIMH